MAAKDLDPLANSPIVLLLIPFCHRVVGSFPLGHLSDGLFDSRRTAHGRRCRQCITLIPWQGLIRGRGRIPGRVMIPWQWAWQELWTRPSLIRHIAQYGRLGVR